jgi:PAS domain S-box-containing protein
MIEPGVGHKLDADAAAQQVLHELRQHQVELKLQNDELRSTQIELEAARSRYFDLYDLAPVSYFTVNNTEYILEANLTAANMLGVASRELSGRSIRHFITPADQDIYYLVCKRLFETDQPQSCELRIIKPDGSKYWVHLTCTHAHAATEIATHRVVMTDINDRKSAQEKLSASDVALKELNQELQVRNIELQSAAIVAEKANLAKSEFLSSMSHELRSPLNAILGFAQLLASGAQPPTASQKGKIEQILRAGWYLLTLINEILDLASIESGKIAVSLEPVSLAAVLLDCQSMIEPQARSANICINFQQSVGPLSVIANPIRLKQVLINLMSNAIKYNRSNGTVDVTFKTDTKGLVRISVQDSGNGLSREKLLQLFQPFNRLGQEAGSAEGTGIGLVVAKRLTELMGGTIGAQSTQGQGSVFWIELGTVEAVPVTDLAQQAPAPLDPELAEPDRMGGSVLYVEDNATNVELVAHILAERPKLKLITASNGTEGIEKARSELPQVILMDINLPGISGVEALKILRQDPVTQHIPVLAVSANAMPLDIVRGLQAGFFRYLTKPIKIDEFLRALDLALAAAPAVAAPAAPAFQSGGS